MAYRQTCISPPFVGAWRGTAVFLQSYRRLTRLPCQSSDNRTSNRGAAAAQHISFRRETVKKASSHSASRFERLTNGESTSQKKKAHRLRVGTNGMTPEETQKVHDWVEVREALLARVASLDPKLANNQNIRPMYAHLLVALRRATITIIRIVADREGTEDGRGAAVDGDGQTEENACFGWMGLNYFTKIWQVTTIV